MTSSVAMIIVLLLLTVVAAMLKQVGGPSNAIVFNPSTSISCCATKATSLSFARSSSMTSLIRSARAGIVMRSWTVCARLYLSPFSTCR